MSGNNEKKLDLDESGAEIIKNIKRSGAFDKVKKDVLEDLQEMNEIKVSRDYMLNLVRINFDKQSRERKYPPTINERRTMLKEMIGNATMFDSLTNSIKQSQVYKDAAEKLASEVDKFVPQHYPDLVFNSQTKQWEIPHPNSSTVPNTETSAKTAFPSRLSYSSHFVEPSVPPPVDEQDMDMDVDSSSTTSSADESKQFDTTDYLTIALPPPPPPPEF